MDMFEYYLYDIDISNLTSGQWSELPNHVRTLGSILTNKCQHFDLIYLKQ